MGRIYSIMDFLYDKRAANSALGRVDARGKLVALLAYSIAILLPWPAWVVISLELLPWVLVIATRLSPLRLLKLLAPVVVLAACAAGFYFLNHGGEEAGFTAVLLALRMVSLVAASLLVSCTTTPTELLRAFKWFIAPLSSLGFPSDDIAFTLALTLRFIPLVAEEFQAVRLAQRARGAELATVGIFRRVTNVGFSFVAVFVGLFRQADSTAQAMDARCYGAKNVSPR